MRKEVIKSLIAIKQSEIPFDVIRRDISLPINRTKEEEYLIETEGKLIHVVPAWKWLLSSENI